ncbi:MAG: PEP-CTERM/exosortase system-associated acyltransferase [Desulfuromonadales bacterium]
MPYRFSYGNIEKHRDYDNVLSHIFALRYQVYINEWGFESADDHPDGLEHDEFDDHSVHIYARSDETNEVIGSIRMIFDSEFGFPIERHFDIASLPAGINRSSTGEISRLAISKEYRRRAIDLKIFGAEQCSSNQLPRYMAKDLNFRRHCEHELVRGLYIALYRDSKTRGLKNWYAVMAKGLYIILKRWGIAFTQIGPARNYHGIRAPYLVSIESIERSLETFDPVLYCDMRSGLMH